MAKKNCEHDILEDGKKYVHHLVTRELFIYTNLEAATIAITYEMTHSSKSFFNKVCDEICDSVSVLTSGQQIADAYVPNLDTKQENIAKISNNEIRPIEKEVLEFIKKRLLQHGNWLLEEYKKAGFKVKAKKSKGGKK